MRTPLRHSDRRLAQVERHDLERHRRTQEHERAENAPTTSVAAEHEAHHGGRGGDQHNGPDNAGDIPPIGEQALDEVALRAKHPEAGLRSIDHLGAVLAVEEVQRIAEDREVVDEPEQNAVAADDSVQHQVRLL